MLCDVEHARDDSANREIGAQRLLVEIVIRLTLLFGPVACFPGFEQFGWLARGCGFVLTQCVEFVGELALYFSKDGFAELKRCAARRCHAALGDVIGKIGLTDE